MPSLLEIENLSTFFDTEGGLVRAVREVSLSLESGRMLALVGESGCGKSVTALSVLQLIPRPPGRFEPASRIRFQGQELLELSEEAMQEIRGNEISMIFQEPMTSLNPIFTVGDQITEAILQHQALSAEEARNRALDMLRQVAISSPERRIDQYPHELSGGMKQRVMIAMAIACRPALLIADEPTTALDVTIQAQILDLLDQLRDQTGMAILLITHNLGIVAQYAHRVAVMYAGKIVEEGTVEEIFEHPAHPYTRGLLNSLPRETPGERLESIPGTVPHPARLPSGCAFHPRCAEALPHCPQAVPGFYPAPGSSPGHRVACYLYEQPATRPVAS